VKRVQFHLQQRVGVDGLKQTRNGSVVVARSSGTPRSKYTTRRKISFGNARTGPETNNGDGVFAYADDGNVAVLVHDHGIRRIHAVVDPARIQYDNGHAHGPATRTLAPIDHVLAHRVHKRVPVGLHRFLRDSHALVESGNKNIKIFKIKIILIVEN